MSAAPIETDYLVIGSGAAGMAFVDTLISETEAHVTLVDRHGKPGGHWNDAYSFVTLHQPSAFYGVNSMELGTRRKDTRGTNRGMYELASGPEICGYFDRVMNQHLLSSGRVDYHPMCNYLGDGQFESLLSGQRTQVTVRKKVVDANYSSPSVPSTHTPKFAVAEGVRLVPPNALPQLGITHKALATPQRYVILGAGKTAMDACVWLIQSGAHPDSIHWVVPRDSWLVNRITTQPAPEFFFDSIGSQVKQMASFAQAQSLDDLYQRLEACGFLTRIDPTRQPSMFHLATVAPGEVEVLRSIRHVIRKGRVRAIEPDRLVLDEGSEPMPAHALYVDCTASAVEPRPVQPIFQANKIVLQLVRLPLPTFSAAVIAYVEARYDGDQAKNRLCATVPFPHRLQDYPRAAMASLWNQAQ
ncbi:MAG: NAD(P)/FAD-dependent oxidoreductase, partial [Rhodoferax sp.]|nr:NAD(P)/FAD-dependent oxidoreductase [Rhodoferax sp.]